MHDQGFICCYARVLFLMPCPLNSHRTLFSAAREPGCYEIPELQEPSDYLLPLHDEVFLSSAGYGAGTSEKLDHALCCELFPEVSGSTRSTKSDTSSPTATNCLLVELNHDTKDAL